MPRASAPQPYLHPKRGAPAACGRVSCHARACDAASGELGETGATWAKGSEHSTR